MELEINYKTSLSLQKSYLGRQISASVETYQNRVNSIKTKLNKSFGKANKMGKMVGKGLLTGMMFLSTGKYISCIGSEKLRKMIQL